MTVGGRRHYTDDDLGHFGVGLKAASFSQAKCLTVMARQRVTRPWGVNGASVTSVIRASYATLYITNLPDSELRRDWRIKMGDSGTAIRWDEVTGFPATDDLRRVEEFIEHTITSTCQHLGIVFHRFLEDGRLSVELGCLVLMPSLFGPPISVMPLNPFAYPQSARPDSDRPSRRRKADSRILLSMPYLAR